ncbi:hypothetical protein CXU20_05435 [Akkermansia muciniphila]|nr:hypothetical protein CXU20_05435 [Akkermansia muciniphila]
MGQISPISGPRNIIRTIQIINHSINICNLLLLMILKIINKSVNFKNIKLFFDYNIYNFYIAGFRRMV